MRAIRSIADDVRQSFRHLRGAPGFTALVVLTLGLGIGANTAIFSIVETVWLEPLPYPGADRLLVIDDRPWNPAEIALELRESSRSLEAIAAYYPQSFAVAGAEGPTQVEGLQVSPGFLRLLGTEPALGRNFDRADARDDAERTAIVSHDLWQRRYGGSRDVIGRVIRINGAAHEIIGVLGQEFRQLTPLTDEPQVWIPFELEPTNAEGLNDGINYAIALARLKDGAILQQAQSELDVVTGRFRERHPRAADSPRWNLRWAPLKSELIENVRPALLVLQLAVGAVLLIACVNVANLLLARFSARRTDLALRSALGASQGRLLRQALIESVILSLLGGAAGLLLMLTGMRLVLGLAPEDIPRIENVSIDVSVLIHTIGVAIGTGILFGIVPAVAANRRLRMDDLRDSGRTQTTSREQRRIGDVLIVVQVATALVLLVGAGLLGRSFLALTAEDPGFQSENVLALTLQIPENRYRSVRELDAFYGQALERLRQISGVESAGLGKNMPLNRGNSIREYRIDGAGGTGVREAQFDAISADYFRTLRIPLLHGRYFEESDRRDSLPVAIIDEAMWHEVWPQQNPVGKRVLFADRWHTVVGVVGNIRGSGLANRPQSGFYIPYRQRPETATELAVGRHLVILIRTRLPGENLMQPLLRAIRDVDPLQPVADVSTLERIVWKGVSPERFRALLTASFAAVALILVVVGIYGVISYAVSRQRHEIGIRMALGALRGDVQRSVIGRTIAVTGLGMLLGLAAAVLMTRFLDGMLHGISPTDPATFASISVLLIATAFCAGYVPSRRAAQVDPMTALRDE